MPHSVVGATHKHFKPAIGVLRGYRIACEHTFKQSPSAPTVTRRSLPTMPQRIVSSASEDLQAAIGIACGGNVAGDYSA
jgi:hypothetical protein